MLFWMAITFLLLMALSGPSILLTEYHRIALWERLRSMFFHHFIQEWSDVWNAIAYGFKRHAHHMSLKEDPWIN